MLNPPARIVVRLVITELVRILGKAIEQVSHLALVPLLERKQKRESLAGKNRLEWRGLTHGAASKDRSIASSSLRPSPSSNGKSLVGLQATRA